MRWWAEEAAGLPAPLDQFGVSHTSQRGYLPFSEVQREDKMKESSHLIKGKRKKRHGHQAYKTGLKGAMLPSPPTLSYSHISSFIYSGTRNKRWCLQSSVWSPPGEQGWRNVVCFLLPKSSQSGWDIKTPMSTRWQMTKMTKFRGWRETALLAETQGGSLKKEVKLEWGQDCSTKKKGKILWLVSDLG